MTAMTQTEPGRTGRMKVHAVQGGGGLRLHVREWGTADGPAILFIHGWSQNHLCWARQYESALADEFRLVAYDLRGHGMSEAPLEPGPYTDGKLWAEDVAAIIEELHLDRPVLVGWSYGAFVICDYVRAYGQDRIAAIDFVEGAVKLGETAFGALIGPRLPRPLRGRHRRRSAGQHRRHALLRTHVRCQAGAGRRPADGGVLERGGAGYRPRQSRCPRDRLRRRTAHP
jgi:pimeloyl-ACP methyl ester carboxylesterase